LPALSTTPYQSQYIAWLLSRQIGRDSPDLLASTLVDARVDLNPHQVEAALFAFRSPLSQGVILADEVGLGKTIEAGLVIAQRWAERQRRTLIITPANLRKQWHQELQDKFSLQAHILEAKSHRELRKSGLSNPFDQPSGVLICSYQFAKTKADELRRVPWDLVVMDEAHRLRNVYKPSNVIGKALKEALANSDNTTTKSATETPVKDAIKEKVKAAIIDNASAVKELSAGTVSVAEPVTNTAKETTTSVSRTMDQPVSTTVKDVTSAPVSTVKEGVTSKLGTVSKALTVKKLNAE